MTDTKRVADREEASTPPMPETTPLSTSSASFLNDHQRERGCKAALPRLSEVVPGWQGDENGLHNSSSAVVVGGEENGIGENGGGSERGATIPLHRRKVMRSRAAPAGPHPYLDRFASGMHRPLEGDDASWREASIQPVPIPDLGHTGIRTKFSTGAGNGFTPDGAMTDTFRTDIHDTVKNLPRYADRDARDMKARDYARAIRKHRVNPCGGSLLNAHMSTLELGGESEGSLLLLSAGGGGVGRGLRQSSSLGTFRSSRFSPPSSPLRALARHGRGRSSGGGYSAGGGGGGGIGMGDGGSGGGGRDSRAMTPAESRQALLLRELSSVKLAAAAMTCGPGSSADCALCPGAGTTDSGGAFLVTATETTRAAGGGGGGGGASLPTTGKRRGGSRKGGSRGTGRNESLHNDECRVQGSRIKRDAAQQGGCGGGGGGGGDEEGGLDFGRSLDEIDEEKGVSGGGGGGGGGTIGVGAVVGGDDAEKAAFRGNRRGRGRRRCEPTEAGVDGGGLMGGGYTDDGHTGFVVPPTRNPSLSSLGQRATPITAAEAAAARDTTNHPSSASPPWSASQRQRKQPPPSVKPKSRRRPKRRETTVRHLKKPFSSDSLLACLLDVRFGNTRDLSPEQPPGLKWDLGSLPAGITAATLGGGAWDGFYESEGEDCDGDGAAGSCACRNERSRFAGLEYRGTSSGGGVVDGGADFAVVREGCCGGMVGDGFGDTAVCGEETCVRTDKASSR